MKGSKITIVNYFFRVIIGEIKLKLGSVKKEKLMKKAIYLAVAVLLMSTVSTMVYACGGMGSMSIEEKTEKKMKMLTNKLELTEEQAVQIKVLVTEKLTKKKAIWEAKMAEIKAVKEEYSAKIQVVLTDEQKVKYEEMKKEWHKGSMKGSMKGSGHEHGGSEMKGSGS